MERHVTIKVCEWDVSNVTNMSYMFCRASSFNQDVSEWDVSNVTNMSYMFCCASSFNQDMSEWDVSNVTDMSCMFYSAISYDQDVSKWDVSRSTFGIRLMFYGSEVAARLHRCCGYHSIFLDHRFMSRIERQEFFSAFFSLASSQVALLFLVSQGFLCIFECEYSYDFDVGIGNRPQQTCDKLFDVEDLYRVICRFL